MPSITKHNIFSSALLCLLWLFLCTSLSYNLQAQAAATNKAQNIIYACKAWGFLKYYHPNMCCNTQWDERLVEVLQRLDTAQANTNLNAEIEYLLRAAADTTTKPHPLYNPFDREVSGGTQATIALDFGWIENSFVRPDVQQRLRSFLHPAQAVENYYLHLESDVRSRIPFFANESAKPDTGLPDKYRRVVGLARLWNFVHYFYPYKNLLDKPWDNVLAEFLPQFLSARTEKEYTAAILQLRTRLNDTHTIVNSRGALSFFGAYYLPVSLAFVEEKVVVKESYPQFGIQRGDILVLVDGERVDSLMQRRSYYLGSANESIKNQILAGYLLRYTESSSATLELFNQEGKKYSALVPCSNRNVYTPSVMPPKPMIQVADSAEKLLYIDFTKITQQQIFPTLDTMMNYPGVVFDLRGYPEWVLYGMMSQLAEVTPFVFVRSPSYRLPGYASEYVLSCGLQRKYMGKVVVLVNEQTQSRAEFTTMALQTIPGMKTVGSQTAGTDGDVRRMRLPGGVTIMLTCKGIYYPNKENTQRIGVRIDVVAKPTIAGIRAGRDEVLEKGVEVLRAMINKKK